MRIHTKKKWTLSTPWRSASFVMGENSSGKGVQRRFLRFPVKFGSYEKMSGSKVVDLEKIHNFAD